MDGSGRVRIRDIADELGLSTATVSNVLHGKRGKASEETARRVLALVEERRYIPSMAGVLLAHSAAPIVGIVVNDHEKYEAHALEDPFIASLLSCLSAEIEAQGRFMMVKRATEAEAIVRFASMWNLEGLVLVGFCTQDYERLRGRMRVPFVVCDGYDVPKERTCNVTIDHRDGGRQMGAYFRRLGHTRALCVADNEICMDAERCEGFREGFGSGADFLKIPMHREERQRFYAENLGFLLRHTAIFAVSDEYAVELMRFLLGRGIGVPGEISVAGFDDAPICERVYPALTTIRQDSVLRARVVLRKLEALCAGEATEPQTVLPVRLVVRESTGRPQA